MATKAQKTSEVTQATRRVEATFNKLEKVKAEADSLAKLLKTQQAHLKWVEAMPVDDEDGDPFTDDQEDQATRPAGADQ